MHVTEPHASVAFSRSNSTTNTDTHSEHPPTHTWDSLVVDLRAAASAFCGAAAMMGPGWCCFRSVPCQLCGNFLKLRAAC